jgi:hypothetical protein
MGVRLSNRRGRQRRDGEHQEKSKPSEQGQETSKSIVNVRLIRALGGKIGHPMLDATSLRGARG